MLYMKSFNEVNLWFMNKIEYLNQFLRLPNCTSIWGLTISPEY